MYYIVGVFKGNQPLGPFWDESANINAIDEEKCNSNFSPKKLGIGLPLRIPGLLFIFNFASQLQTHMDESPKEFYQAMKTALHYHTLHSRMTKKLLKQNDEDLFKSRIIHVAFAFLFHWYDTSQDRHLRRHAQTALDANHISCEKYQKSWQLYTALKRARRK